MSIAVRWLRLLLRSGGGSQHQFTSKKYLGMGRTGLTPKRLRVPNSSFFFMRIVRFHIFIFTTVSAPSQSCLWLYRRLRHLRKTHISVITDRIIYNHAREPTGNSLSVHDYTLSNAVQCFYILGIDKESWCPIDYARRQSSLSTPLQLRILNTWAFCH